MFMDLLSDDVKLVCSEFSDDVLFQSLTLSYLLDLMPGIICLEYAFRHNIELSCGVFFKYDFYNISSKMLVSRFRELLNRLSVPFYEILDYFLSFEYFSSFALKEKLHKMFEVLFCETFDIIIFSEVLNYEALSFTTT